MIGSLRSLHRRSPRLCLASVMDARWSSKPQDGVRLPGGVLKSTCPGSVPDSHVRSAKLEDQVRLLAGTLECFAVASSGKEGAPWPSTTSTNSHFFETMSKRRKGFPSETQVKRGVRIVGDGKMLEEKLGRNDLCPCSSGKRFKKCCLKKGRF